MIILTTKCWRIGKSCTHDSRPDKSAIYHSWGRFAPHSWCIADFRIPFSSLLTRCARQVVIRRGFAGRSSFVQDFPILQHFVVRINTFLVFAQKQNLINLWNDNNVIIYWRFWKWFQRKLLDKSDKFKGNNCILKWKKLEKDWFLKIKFYILLKMLTWRWY